MDREAGFLLVPACRPRNRASNGPVFYFGSPISPFKWKGQAKKFANSPLRQAGDLCNGGCACLFSRSIWPAAKMQDKPSFRCTKWASMFCHFRSGVMMSGTRKRSDNGRSAVTVVPPMTTLIADSTAINAISNWHTRLAWSGIGNHSQTHHKMTAARAIWAMTMARLMNVTAHLTCMR